MSDNELPVGGLTRRSLGGLGVAAILAPSIASARRMPGPDRYRPQVHYSPAKGFMNDPNGLIFHEGEYHLFYQHNPFEAKAGHVHWGHAVSSDLVRWRELPIALGETAAGQAFSGSAVYDRGNTSGLFPSGAGGLVAIYTRASDTKQAQEIATSTDRGRTFSGYPGNPVLDVGSASFRDPKVLWHAPTRRWVMVVVRSREHRVMFYASSDLKHWSEVGSFGHAGLLGIDYECPDLVEVPVEGGGTRWVLFVSINPGAPLGGSAVQYFVGTFDGRRFEAEDGATRLADFGQDFYALQTFADVDGPPVAIAWMSNWLYSNDVPASPSRGAMTLPRRLTLRRHADDWRLVQTPVPLDPIAGSSILSGPRPKRTGTLAGAAVPYGAALEVVLRFEADPGAILSVRLRNAAGEMLSACFDAGTYPGFVVDRSGTRGFRHRYMVDRAIWSAPQGTTTTDMRLIVDRSSIELIGMGGEASGTMLQYFASPPDRLEVIAEGGAVALMQLEVRSLNG
ncbi:GH32 C-terminal domain-containing protein [uncultured Sphingomonas sp.]|uniref:GH32 C-terminal domain-containing protein n=1 Tax=uncultured Sphingomonas sp. TaxID=158754 RepID=UPI0035CB36B5